MARTQTQSEFIGKSENVGADGCVSINFYRPPSSNPVSVMGIPLEEGASLKIEQNVGDEDHTFYQIIFTQTVVGANALFVTKIMPL
jgi:hypothetical protein